MSSGVELRIAGECLHFRAPPGREIAAPAGYYRGFLYQPESDSGESPDCRHTTFIEVLTDPAPTLARFTAVFDTGDAWTLHRRGDTFDLRLRPPGQADEPIWTLRANRSFDRCELYCGTPLLALEPGAGAIPHVVQYPLDQLVMIHRLALGDGLLVHAAAAHRDRRAIVFAGPSGAGKSTITRALGKQSRDLRWLSDDRVVLRREHPDFAVHGTPWPGDAAVAENDSGTLCAICFLRHGATTTIRPLDDKEALTRLLPVASIPWYEKGFTDTALAFCNDLLERTPSFELEFRPDSEDLASVLDEQWSTKPHTSTA